MELDEVKTRWHYSYQTMIVGFRAQNHPQQVGTRGSKVTVDDRETPPELFDPLNARFGFTLDVAASAGNAKCARYFTREDNGLEQSWAGERVWCNPPYSDIGSWIIKAWRESASASLIVLLVPSNRTEQRWWQAHIEPFRDGNGHDPCCTLRVEFLAGRQRFIAPGDFVDMFGRPRGGDIRPPFGVCLVIFGYVHDHC